MYHIKFAFFVNSINYTASDKPGSFYLFISTIYRLTGILNLFATVTPVPLGLDVVLVLNQVALIFLNLVKSTPFFTAAGGCCHSQAVCPTCFKEYRALRTRTAYLIADQLTKTLFDFLFFFSFCNVFF